MATVGVKGYIGSADCRTIEPSDNRYGIGWAAATVGLTALVLVFIRYTRCRSGATSDFPSHAPCSSPAVRPLAASTPCSVVIRQSRAVPAIRKLTEHKRSLKWQMIFLTYVFRPFLVIGAVLVTPGMHCASLGRPTVHSFLSFDNLYTHEKVAQNRLFFMSRNFIV